MDNYFLDSPYQDVSGLPDPYMEQMPMDMEDSSKAIPPHMSLSYEDNLGSGYSTPNSRNRRVIKEIIVWKDDSLNKQGRTLKFLDAIWAWNLYIFVKVIEIVFRIYFL